MAYRVGNLWAVKAHNRIRYFRRRPTKQSIAKVARDYKRLARA